MRLADRIPVLMYHRVGEPNSVADIYCIRPGDFAAHIRALAEAGYQAVSIEDFHAWHQGTKQLPTGAFVLTFDDGFTGVHEFAAPVLQELKWPATVFLVAGKLGGQSDWEVTTNEPMHAHPLMDTLQLLSLVKQGFSLHSHSLLHRDLTKLPPLALADDLSRSRFLLAETFGHEPSFIAYPYGRHNQAVREATQNAAFKLAFSVESGFNRPGENQLQIRRLDVFGNDTPTMLLRKIRLGANDGSLAYLLRYYFHRLFRQI